MLIKYRWGGAGLLAVAVAAGVLGAAPAHAVAGGTPGTYAFVAKINVGDRSCTGSLLDPQWVITAASCFPENIPAGQTTPAGKPKKPTTATVGRADLSTATGHVVTVVDLVGRPDRNLVLARLETRITDIAPVPISTTAPAAGDILRVAGYGRTATEWVPDLQHTAQFAVRTITGGTGIEVGPHSPADASICKGDSGGPAFREVAGRVELVAINDRSWQGGCLAETETRREATETRLDNIAGWIAEQTRFRGIPAFYEYGPANTALWLFDNVADAPKLRMPWSAANWAQGRSKPVSGDFDGDGKLDVAAMYNLDGARTTLSVFDNVGGTQPLSPRQVWDSGNGNWGWDRGTPLAGDFDGDGKDDIAAFFDYGGGRTALFLFTRLASTAAGVQLIWDSGNGQWEQSRAKPVAGDFNGDGKDEIAAMYDYGSGSTGLWLFEHVATSDGTPYRKQVWNSGNGNWEWNRGTPVAGDFDGDGTDEITAFYDYTGGNTASYLFSRLLTSAVSVKRIWDSGNGQWEQGRAKPVAGDFNADGKDDIAAMYDYGSSTAIWLFDHVAATDSTPYNKQVWSASNGNWEWNRGSPVTSSTR